MSTHQTNKDKPRSIKCRHFCFPFDPHNYCPTCRESSKGDDPCVTFEILCPICTSFTGEQMLKISQKKHYIKKQKSNTTSSKDDGLDLSIRTSLIPGEWVLSIDLSDAYIHIPVHPNSRKYLRFCYRPQVLQVTSLPFGLATAPRSLQ